MRCGRLTVDLMRAVPVARLTTTARVVREGSGCSSWKRPSSTTAPKSPATALRIRIGDSADALTHPRRPDESPPPPPTKVEESVLARAGLPVPGFLLALDMHRVTGGLGQGAPSCTWFRLHVPVVAGEETSPFVRLAALADFTSGTANYLPIDRWSSINADVSIHMLREPVGEWIAVDAVAHAAGDGIGHSCATLYDTAGMVGTGSTAQFLDQVAAPFAQAAKLTGEAGMNEIVPTPGGAPGDDEGVLDPQVAAWFDANPMYVTPLESSSPSCSSSPAVRSAHPSTREFDEVRDDAVDGVPIRIYRDDPSTGVVVYFHGGGFCIGSIGLMDNVARELRTRRVRPWCRWSTASPPSTRSPRGSTTATPSPSGRSPTPTSSAERPEPVAVAGESAGGNLSAAVALRRRDAGGPRWPRRCSSTRCRRVPGLPVPGEFSGLIISEKAGDVYWTAYSGDQDVSVDPYAAPLRAPSLAGLPPALVILGGCDMLRDEGRAYARRLESEGVEVDEVCIAGQPHGFVNFDLPAAAVAHERIGTWVRQQLARGASR